MAEKEYYEALERLVRNKPINVSQGSKINNDTVALEAGRQRGAIKNQRYPTLCKEIKAAAENQKETPLQQTQRMRDSYKVQRDKYKELLGKALGRELMLVERLKELESEFDEIKKRFPMFRI